MLLRFVITILSITILVVMLTGCAETTGGPVGSVVIDAPLKVLSATIIGQVIDKRDGSGMEGVHVEIKGYDYSATTDERGYFLIEFKGQTRLGINRLRVQVIASKEGFRTRSRGLYVEQQKKARVEIPLLPTL